MVIAIVREADRAIFVLEDPARGVAGPRHPLDPFARIRLVEHTWLAGPLVVTEVGVAPPLHKERRVRVGHRPEHDALPAYERDRRDGGHPPSESATEAGAGAPGREATRGLKSGGSAFVSRSFVNRAIRS